MDQLHPFLPRECIGRARAAIFMSGSGTNAEVLLKCFADGTGPCRIALVATDNPDSRAAELAQRFHVPLAVCDIRAFYREHGESSIALVNARRRALREEWTDELRRNLEPFAIDFGLLAGFVPLTNLTGDFPCLNVHPADLTLEDGAGRRLLAGLHTVPMENALCDETLSGALRSSVIVAQPFTGDGRGEMDSGPVLGVSAPMAAELEGSTAAELRAVRAARLDGKRPKEGDLLSRLAARNLERLKYAGDHVVFPAATAAFAAGRYAQGSDGKLWFANASGVFEKVTTVEFDRDGNEEPRRR